MSKSFILFSKSGTRGKMDIEQLEKMMKERLGGNCKIWGIAVQSGDTSLEASITGGDEFPSMDVNATTDDGRYYALSNAELANSDNPFITTRLYAGNSDLETDSPIAFMAHGERYKDDDSRRVVYVDNDLVKTESDVLWGVGDRSDIMLTEKSAVNITKKRYIVTMNEDYIRDSQAFYANDKNLDDNNDEDWGDFSAPAYLGVVHAINAQAAIQKIAKERGLPVNALHAEEI